MNIFCAVQTQLPLSFVPAACSSGLPGSTLFSHSHSSEILFLHFSREGEILHTFFLVNGEYPIFCTYLLKGKMFRLPVLSYATFRTTVSIIKTNYINSHAVPCEEPNFCQILPIIAMFRQFSQTLHIRHFTKAITVGVALLHTDGTTAECRKVNNRYSFCRRN